ncbi:MAG TPA: tripartite tricarboxylate transporter substrate binding protein [Casimicrobiaceae bacterium]|jgi:tripartite-type tricarboxylate transporter receptor subunit TctC
MNVRAGWAMVLAIVLALSTNALAGDYPDRPIRVVVPAPTGNSLDLVTRIVVDGMAADLGQPIIVENRPGAGTNIGNQFVAKAKPDGYTLLFGAATLAINPSVYDNLNYDPQRDLAPIALATRITNVVIVNANSPPRDIAGLIAWCRANPGKLNYTSPGVGTSVHLGGELFKSMIGVDIVHIPYKTSGDGIAAILAGDAHMAFENLPFILPFIQALKLRALAVTSTRRSPMLPDVPTMAEAGLAGYDVTTWFGVLAPAGTPSSVVERLHRAARNALEMSEIRQSLLATGAEIATEGPAEFRSLLRTETERWAGIARKAQVRAN